MTDKKSIIKLAAKDIFIKNGFKGTNISEIMKSSNMAVGTFYNYFKSKDEIFMEIYLEENAKVKKLVLDSVDKNDNPLHVITRMMTYNISLMKENPILKEWFNKEIFHKIEKSFHEKNGFDSVDFLYSGFTEIVKSWQNSGIIRNDISPEMIMAIFNSLVQVEAHKSEIGIGYFPDLLQYLSEFIMNGLLTNPSK